MQISTVNSQGFRSSEIAVSSFKQIGTPKVGVAHAFQRLVQTEIDSQPERVRSGSPQIRRIFELVEKVAKATSNVLLTGESGTGKEMIALAIHNKSARSHKQFVAINCSAIPVNLLESELFGHKRGAFTGAQEARRGLFEEANGGTIFLDEIGDMPFEFQAKMLRVIQEREIRPIGENKSKPIDVRIIAATHKDLGALVREGKFREDLYYRLSVVPIQLPSLRERKEDIIMLAECFLKKYCLRNQVELKYLSKTAMAKLLIRRWPGNVRELENVIERAVVLSEKVIIDDYEIPAEIGLENKEGVTELFSRLMTFEEIEKQYIQYVISQTGKSKEKAALILGINRKTLYRKEMAYGIRDLT